MQLGDDLLGELVDGEVVGVGRDQLTGVSRSFLGIGTLRSTPPLGVHVNVTGRMMAGNPWFGAANGADERLRAG